MADGTDDLKARLGLKKRKKKKEEEEAAAKAKAEADAVAAKAAAKEQAAASIAEARARAAAADAEAGPAAEEFGFMGAESTPVPERYEGPQYVVVEGSEEMASQAKQRLMIIGGTAVITFLIAFFMGSMSGKASAETETIDLYAKQAEGMLKNISGAQDKSGANTLERIDALKAQLDAVQSKIAAVVNKAGGAQDSDWTALQPQLEKVVGEMGKYKSDNVFIDPQSITSELFTLGPVANFAVRTKQLYDKVASAFSEAQSIAKVATATPEPDQMVRLVVTEVGFREVTQQSWWKTGADGKRVKMTECKDAKDCNAGFICKPDIKKCHAKQVPERKVAAVVKAVPDIGRQQVGTVDPKDPNSAPVYDWKMVLVLDEKDKETGKPKVKVSSTKDVLQMNLSAAFTQMANKASVLVSQRLATIILEAKQIADNVRWSKIEPQLKACANDKKCTFSAK